MNKNIAIIEDNKDFSDTLCQLLNSVNIKTTAFKCAEDFLNDMPNNINCIITDIRMAGLSGLQLQGRLNELKINTPLIIISGHGNIDISVQAMKDGAKDFLTKPIRNQNLLDCIFNILREQDENKENNKKHRSHQKNKEELTQREKEIWIQICNGLSSKVIAEKLDISKNTVEVHRARIMKKMKCISIGKLISDAYRYSLNEMDKYTCK